MRFKMIFFFNHDKWDVIAVLMVYASQLVVLIYNHSGGDNFGVSSCRWTLSWQRANNNNLPELFCNIYCFIDLLIRSIYQ